jgi:Protein of unknown function (DUF1573)
MKAALFAVVSLVLGIAVGLWFTQREFAYETLPIAVTPVSRSATTTTQPAAKAAPAPAAGKRGPVAVVVNGEHHDFGTMDRNAHGAHVFQVRNNGDAPLTLLPGQPTCKCTVFSSVKERLEPGEQTEVKIEWDVKTTSAEFEQSGPLNTNDPRRPSIQLTIHGRVSDVIRPDRFDMHFSELSANDSATGSVNIYAFRTADLKVEQHELSNPSLAPFVNVSFTPLTEDEVAREPLAKGGVKMTVDLKSGMPFGEFNNTISVRTDQNPTAPLEIHLIGNVSTDVLLSGPKTYADKLLVNLGTLSRAEATKHTVYILVKGPHRDATEVKIEKLEPNIEFKATLGDPNRDNPKIVRFPLVIEVPAQATPVSRAADGAYALIHLATTHPDVKELTIKVRYIVKD